MHDAKAQITTPVIKAGFGVDGDLLSNYFNGAVQTGNDDWFLNSSGNFVIDTSGAASIRALYNSNASSRLVPFIKRMQMPQFSVVSNRLMFDAVFVRDHHGDDSTVFASTSNKNGMSPISWTCPVAQSVPDKNEILDVYMHVRRDGVQNTDSLWMMGAIAIENTNGNRYFDFEMYQTDLTFNKTTRVFSGFGAQAGHTSWEFDASGNVTRAGDIIFTAEFSGSSLSLLQARVWVHSSALSITPNAFSWGGDFNGDGNGAVYGYASIVPKASGDFYTGLQSAAATSGCPFGVIFQNNTVNNDYLAGQFLEFSVNLTKLGLDPFISLGVGCAFPFKSILVKTRASSSFTAELKDFVAPFSFFSAPAAELSTNMQSLCAGNVSTVYVSNPLSTSVYRWSSLSGNIVGDSVGTSINVNQAGSYVVRQLLSSNCGNVYARDTISITMATGCNLLNNSPIDLYAVRFPTFIQLSWSQIADAYHSFVVEKSYNGVLFSSIKKVQAFADGVYHHSDLVDQTMSKVVYYRLKYMTKSGQTAYSSVVTMNLNGPDKQELIVVPNPVIDHFSVQFADVKNTYADVVIVNALGTVVYKGKMTVKPGLNQLNINRAPSWGNGYCVLFIKTPDTTLRKRLLIQ